MVGFEREFKNFEGFYGDPQDELTLFLPAYPNELTQEEADKISLLIEEVEKDASIEIREKNFKSSITGENLGNEECYTQEWVWPKMFREHYVKKHRVRPSEKYLKYIGYDVTS